MNISTLIKGAPFLYGDGTIGLPVYHEFISKFGEILHFDKAGILIGKQRLSAGNDHALQPVLLPCNANEALILMRHSGDDHRNVVSVFTRDGGQHWTKPEKSTLFNPDAALSAITLADGRILAVLNNQVQKRDALTLVLSGDGGKSWKNVYLLEDQRGKPVDVANYQITVAGLAKEIIGATNDAFVKSAQSAMCSASECRFEFSYPYLIQTRKGDFHLVYTWNRSFIKHLWFSQAWLDQQSKETGHD
jgi:predicted neuraminidase